MNDPRIVATVNVVNDLLDRMLGAADDDAAKTELLELVNKLLARALTTEKTFDNLLMLVSEHDAAYVREQLAELRRQTWLPGEDDYV